MLRRAVIKLAGGLKFAATYNVYDNFSTRPIALEKHVAARAKPHVYKEWHCIELSNTILRKDETCVRG